jgi:hypothetical protein
MDAATIVGRQKSAGAVGALPNPLCRRARNALERIAGDRAGAIIEPRRGISPSIEIDFSRGDHDIEPAAATAALGTGEALGRIEAQGTGVV